MAGSTVYAVFKNKRGLLTALRETWHQTSQVRDLYAAAGQQEDPAGRLEGFAHATRRQWATGATMIVIYTGAAAADPEAAAELYAALAGRRKNVAAWLAGSVPLFRNDLTEAQVNAIYLALTRTEVYQELVEMWGWTPEAYEHWLAGVLKQQLLP